MKRSVYGGRNCHDVPCRGDLVDCSYCGKQFIVRRPSNSIACSKHCLDKYFELKYGN